MKMRQKTVTVQQIQELDRMAIERLGIPSIALMENAGRSVAQEVCRRVKRIKRPKVAVVCGVGNNAGDGFVAARHLINAGVNAFVFIVGNERRLKHDAAVNFRILKKLKHPIHRAGTRRYLQWITRADIVVDAVFGAGISRDITQPYLDVINTLNNYAKKILAVDIPSGLDGTTGSIYGVCVRADWTVTFSFAKTGFTRGAGPLHTGRVIVADIGIPKKLLTAYRMQLKNG